jgi:hypothetical protein
MFRKPEKHLPYLFLHSTSQQSGKSSFHEALSTLFRDARGYADAKEALMSKNGFNSKLCGAVLCKLEEIDLNKNRDAYERIKEWVTAKYVTIRKLYENPYDEVNCTHWIQCANSAGYCPVQFNDTRIVMVQVPPLSEQDRMGLPEFYGDLDKEAPAFLHTLMGLEFPETSNRLGLPSLETSSKEDQVESNMTPLQAFLKEMTEPCPGAAIPWLKFVNSFTVTLDVSQRVFWPMKRIKHETPADYPRGLLHPSETVHLGNLKWKADDQTESVPFIRRGDRLVRIK